MGQELDVRVVGVDRENKKIALSLKQVEENPWTRIEQKYHVGDTVPAKITKLAQFGAFAELEPGVEGLVHISELSDERITHPKQVVREGEDVSLRIIKIDPQRHRLGLSLRQAEDTGEYAYAGGGYEAWTGGTSYALGGSDTSDGGEEAAEHAERNEHDEHAARNEHAEQNEHDEQDEHAAPPEEPAENNVHLLGPEDSEPAATEPAANGTARVPEH